LVIYLKNFLQNNLLRLFEQFSNINNQHNQNINLVQSTLRDNLSSQTENLTKQMLNISNLLETKVANGLEKNSATFTDIVKRLALIDSTQKNINEVSSNLMGLQKILADKKSRGAFGEIQLKNLIENMLPRENFQLQYTLPNGTRCDCLLLLPSPTNNIAIDAKFPLESFQKIIDLSLSDLDRQKYTQLFKQNIKKHIEDISQKYIIPNETANGAMMFIPAEAVFAEIHNNHIDLVEFSYRKKVWMTSPTTMMAILTTASSVLKDHATKKNITVIQQHLRTLSQDFARFNDRVNKLTKHIELSWNDAQLVQTSANKISSKFTKIEQVDLVEVD
jgi:DNA recombination protein RmuC